MSARAQDMHQVVLRFSVKFDYLTFGSTLVFACYERKSSAAAPFVYCMILLGQIAILNSRREFFGFVFKARRAAPG